MGEGSKYRGQGSMGFREILESREEETEAVKRRDLEKKSRERGIREK